MSLFNKNDKIFDYQHGEGVIDDLLGGYVYLNFKGNKLSMEYKDAKSRLSFTPYDLIHGGFSQERPKPEIKEGDVIYFRGDEYDMWKMSKVSSVSENAIYLDIPQSPYYINKLEFEISLENPYINDQGRGI